MEKMRFEKKKGQWVEITPLTDERMGEIREKHTSRIIHFPERQDGNARIQIADSEQIVDCRRVTNNKGDVTRMEFAVLDLFEYAKQVNLESIAEFDGWEKKTKEELVDDVNVSAWLFPKITEARKQAGEMHGGTSAAKNS